MTLTLRAATNADEAFIHALVPRFVEHGAADGHTDDEVIDGTRRVLSDALHAQRADETILIAEDERGEPAGFIYAVTHRDFFTDEPYAHISEVAVARSGAGVGAALIEAAETWASERNYRFLSLNFVEGNTAQRLYERLGFAPGHRHFVKRLR
ncbi:MAG: GNAT family N-acetyltransferase [Candidatus Eremiobacteraeota bacterium]|nr:GNAT family N-acetyltransferase [Candidatus Eremiobacteraeota bacterium]MBV9407241.1 GNAT family N-acetyltransferase [Candidatus Eremiobacteraeota bacterium]